jgi:hypothetical protein
MNHPQQDTDVSNEYGIDLNLDDGNKCIVELIKEGKPFTVTRLATESFHSFLFVLEKKFVIPDYLANNTGIYSKNQQDIAAFYVEYYKAVMESDSVSIYLDRSDTLQQEKFLISIKYKHPLKFIHFKILEPFYSLQLNKTPWTHSLLGKKVLIISPFVDSFQKQLANNFKLFNDPSKCIFLPGQEFVFYKTFNTSAGNQIHNNWVETLNIMMNDISKIDFDIALISCGGYALVMGSIIKNHLKKSAIYVGGVLQIYFGVMGKRWDTHDLVQRIIRENDECKFIRPSGDEIIKNFSNIETGCYW